MMVFTRTFGDSAKSTFVGSCDLVCFMDTRLRVVHISEQSKGMVITFSNDNYKAERSGKNVINFVLAREDEAA